MLRWVVLCGIRSNCNSCRTRYVGGIALLATIVLFQLGLATRGTTVPWASPLPIVSLVAAGCSLTLFVYWEWSKASQPIIPIKAIIERTIASSLLSSLFSYGSYVVVPFNIPIYLQVTRCSSGQAGIRLIALALAFGFTSFGCGVAITKSARHYWLNTLFQCLEVTGAALLCILTLSTPKHVHFICLAVLGMGTGGILITLLLGLLSATGHSSSLCMGISIYWIYHGTHNCFHTISAYSSNQHPQ